MKTFARFTILALAMYMIGCATQGGSSGSSSPAASSESSSGSSTVKMLTDKDFQRLGIKETAGSSK